MKIRPFQGQVLLEVIGTPSRSHGGVHFPDNVKIKDAIGRSDMALAKVKRLGPWPQLKDGRLINYEVGAGDLVYIDPSLGRIVQANGVQYRLIDHKQIAALITNDESFPG